MLAQTPPPPYYAVIFSSIHTHQHQLEYEHTAKRMIALARQQEGFLGMESAREELGITVSYWHDLEAIKQWRQHTEHTMARAKGRTLWYSTFKVRISKVEREYGF